MLVDQDNIEVIDDPELVILTNMDNLMEEFKKIYKTDKEIDDPYSFRDFTNSFFSYASENRGVVLSLSEYGDAFSYETFWRQSTDRKMLAETVASFIKKIYEASESSLKYVAIIGDDPVVPFGRFSLSHETDVIGTIEYGELNHKAPLLPNFNGLFILYDRNIDEELPQPLDINIKESLPGYVFYQKGSGIYSFYIFYEKDAKDLTITLRANYDNGDSKTYVLDSSTNRVGPFTLMKESESYNGKEIVELKILFPSEDKVSKISLEFSDPDKVIAIGRFIDYKNKAKLDLTSSGNLDPTSYDANISGYLLSDDVYSLDYKLGVGRIVSGSPKTYRLTLETANKPIHIEKEYILAAYCKMFNSPCETWSEEYGCSSPPLVGSMLGECASFNYCANELDNIFKEKFGEENYTLYRSPDMSESTISLDANSFILLLSHGLVTGYIYPIHASEAEIPPGYIAHMIKGKGEEKRCLIYSLGCNSGFTPSISNTNIDFGEGAWKYRNLFPGAAFIPYCTYIGPTSRGYNPSNIFADRLQPSSLGMFREFSNVLSESDCTPISDILKEAKKRYSGRGSAFAKTLILYDLPTRKVGFEKCSIDENTEEEGDEEVEESVLRAFLRRIFKDVLARVDDAERFLGLVESMILLFQELTQYFDPENPHDAVEIAVIIVTYAIGYLQGGS